MGKECCILNCDDRVNSSCTIDVHIRCEGFNAVICTCCPKERHAWIRPVLLVARSVRLQTPLHTKERPEGYDAENCDASFPAAEYRI
jgi:hypothetical protein